MLPASRGHFGLRHIGGFTACPSPRRYLSAGASVHPEDLGTFRRKKVQTPPSIKWESAKISPSRLLKIKEDNFARKFNLFKLAYERPVIEKIKEARSAIVEENKKNTREQRKNKSRRRKTLSVFDQEMKAFREQYHKTLSLARTGLPPPPDFREMYDFPDELRTQGWVDILEGPHALVKKWEQEAKQPFDEYPEQLKRYINDFFDPGNPEYYDENPESNPEVDMTLPMYEGIEQDNQEESDDTEVPIELTYQKGDDWDPVTLHKWQIEYRRKRLLAIEDKLEEHGLLPEGHIKATGRKARSLADTPQDVWNKDKPKVESLARIPPKEDEPFDFDSFLNETPATGPIEPDDLVLQRNAHSSKYFGPDAERLLERNKELGDDERLDPEDAKKAAQLYEFVSRDLVTEQVPEDEAAFNAWLKWIPEPPINCSQNAQEQYHVRYTHTFSMDPDIALGPKAQRTFRLRKVRLSVVVPALCLPEPAEKRMKALVGKRYNPDTEVLTIVADRFPSKEENRMYATQLLKALVEESLLADPNYIPENDAYLDLDELDKLKLPPDPEDGSYRTFTLLPTGRPIPAPEAYRKQNGAQIKALLGSFEE